MIRNTLYEYSGNTLVITFTFYRIIFWDFGTIKKLIIELGTK